MCPFAFCSKIATYFKWAHCFGHCDFYQMGTLSFLMGTAVFQMGTHVFQMGTHVFQMGTQSSLVDPTLPETGTRLSLMGTTSPQTGTTFCPSGHTCFPKGAHRFCQVGTIGPMGTNHLKNMFSDIKQICGPWGTSPPSHIRLDLVAVQTTK